MFILLTFSIIHIKLQETILLPIRKSTCILQTVMTSVKNKICLLKESDFYLLNLISSSNVSMNSINENLFFSYVTQANYLPFNFL